MKKQTVKHTTPMRSTTKEAKQIIRKEIKAYYEPRKYGGKSVLDAMKSEADSYSAGRNKSDWGKGAALVDGGRFACYYDDQRVMLRKIYGNKVDNWDGDKVHNTYRNLIGREYSSMLSEREKAKTSATVKHRAPSTTQKRSTKKK